MKHPCWRCIVQATCYVGCPELWDYYCYQKVVVKKYHKIAGRFLHLSIIISLIWAVLVFTNTIVPAEGFTFTYKGQVYHKMLHLGPYLGSISLALFFMGMNRMIGKRIRSIEQGKCHDFIFRTIMEKKKKKMEKEK